MINIVTRFLNAYLIDNPLQLNILFLAIMKGQVG